MALPSWVPDLEAAVPDNLDRSMLNLKRKYMNGSNLLFSAGTQRDMELRSSREDELRLGGRRMDSIRRIFQKPPPNLWHDGESLVLMQHLRADWHRLLESDPHLDLSHYPSGGTYTEAFYRTCVCDTLGPKDRSIRRVTEDDGEILKNGLAQHGYAPGSGIYPTTTFFITHRGYIGVGPEDTQVGDVLYVLFGGHVPFLLREIPETPERRGSHTFVGHTYVHGIMDGEALKADIQDQEVIIV
ncbi:hypothetical protein F5883DRAFT_696048 [Diaporthe sp. PMI_573]|nr:hypothetical protein F5883DRAFT_696048 [Diaporthaceae sp. PMI_573]